MAPVVLPIRSLAASLSGWRSSGSTAPAYVALADAVRLLAVEGRLPIGTRLPAERPLADALGLSRTTVANAWARLREDGYLASVRGSGSVVRLPTGAGGGPDVEDLGTVLDDAILDLRRAILPAAPGVAEAAGRALGALPGALAQPGYDTLGDPGLRAAIAERYAERGLPTDPGQIMVTLGAQHALSLLVRVLVRPRDAVLVESPSYPHALERLREAGRRVIGVPVDRRSGWDVDLLVEVLRRTAPAVAYVMPDLQNPTGATMSASTRAVLLETAVDSGTVVIADETMGELRVDGDVEAPLAALGPAVMIGSTSKVFWGALRIGWIRADRDLLQRLLLGRPSGDLGTPLLDQLVVRELMPTTSSVLRARRDLIAEARDDLVPALRTRLPEWDVPSPAGGLSTWVDLGRPASRALVLAARREGLLLASGAAFGPRGGFDRFLRVPFSAASADRARTVAAIATAWDRLDARDARQERSRAAVV